MHGLLVMLSQKIDGVLLDAAGDKLRIVANFAVGFENIDLAACARRGICATNTPDVLTDATADIAWTLILATARRAGEGERLVRAGKWAGWEPSQLLGAQVTGATLGVLGAGRIGTAVGLRAAGFRMHVLYTHPRVNAALEAAVGAHRVEFGELLEQSDFLSINIPMRPEHWHMFGAAQFARMKPNAILINTARGAIIDEAALIEALRQRVIAAAGLDVYEFEPKLSPGLADLDNVVVLPHLGSATVSTRTAISTLAAENIIAVLSGRPPITPVTAG